MGEREKWATKSKCTARKFPVRINCQKSKKNKQTNKLTIIQNGPCRCGHCQQEWEGEVKREKEEEEEGEEKCLIARLGKQNELVLTTHLGICVLTLWQLEEPLKAAQAAKVKKEGKAREKGKGAAAMGELLFCVRAKV